VLSHVRVFVSPAVKNHWLESSLEEEILCSLALSKVLKLTVASQRHTTWDYL